VVAVDEAPAPIGNTVRLRKLRMVAVIPWNETMGGAQHGLGFLAVAITAFGIHREHRDLAQKPSARNTVHGQLTTETTTYEIVEFIVLPGCDIHPARSIAG